MTKIDIKHLKYLLIYYNPTFSLVNQFELHSIKRKYLMNQEHLNSKSRINYFNKKTVLKDCRMLIILYDDASFKPNYN